MAVDLGGRGRWRKRLNNRLGGTVHGSLGSVHSTPDSILASNFPDGDLQAQVGVDMDHHLGLTASLDALDGELGNGFLCLPYNLTGLLFLILIGVEVRAINVLFGLASLLLLRLRLRLGDLDLAGALANADDDISAILGRRVLSNAAGGQSCLGVQERLEVDLVAGNELDTDGVAKVGSSGDHGVDGLLDVFLVELLDQRSLDRGTPGGQFGGVDGAGSSGRGKDLGLLRECVPGQIGNLGGVRGTSREDNLK